MADLSKIYLYRMTHIANVPHILLHGITHRTSANANPDFSPIGDPSLISTRDGFLLDNGRTLGEYIPFYFGARMPMLYVIHHGLNGVKKLPSSEIVYCVTSVSSVIKTGLEFVFTNGHAVDKFSSQYSKEDLNNIENILDMNAIKAKYWKVDDDLDLKRRKEAEFLIAADLPIDAVLGFIVYDETAKNQLLQFGLAENQIHINANAYF
jgi:hypothetical protein